jgi:hypothetical protein
LPRELRFNNPNASPTVPTAAGTFSPLRTAPGLDEHSYSFSVIEKIVAATARFSSFRDATDAVQMSRIAISESQVRRLAHEVGRELIAERDRKVIEHRRRQLQARVEVKSKWCNPRRDLLHDSVGENLDSTISAQPAPTLWKNVQMSRDWRDG